MKYNEDIVGNKIHEQLSDVFKPTILRKEMSNNKMGFKLRLRATLNKLATTASGHDKYGNNGYVILSGKKYIVGKMSYDECYIEPYRKNRTERDTFHKDTLWEKHDTAEIVDLLEANGYYLQ